MSARDIVLYGIPLNHMQVVVDEQNELGLELQELLIAPDGEAVMWFSPVEVQVAESPTVPREYLNLGRRRTQPSDWAPVRFELGMLPAGVYRHYKGPLYLVLGLGHDANAGELYDNGHSHDPEPLGERVVVVYVGLQLDAAKEGPRLAVRTLEDFNEVVCTNAEHSHYGDSMANPYTTCDPHRRFEYLGSTYTAGMEQL